MISRYVTCTIQPDKIDEFRDTLNTKFLPRIQSQPGFVENLESLDPVSGKFTCMTVWKDQTAVDRYNKGLFQEVAEALTPLTSEPPEVTTLPVENSSVHKIKAGRAAA